MEVKELRILLSTSSSDTPVHPPTPSKLPLSPLTVLKLNTKTNSQLV